MIALNEKLKDDRICMSYLGAFDDEITSKLIEISEFYLENRSEIGKLKNRVSFLIAECFQNIVRHGGAKEKARMVPEGHQDFFQLNVLGDRAALSSCNLIDKALVDVLKKKLDQINSLDAGGLKKLYQEMMETGFSEKGGAGLGLIEMARKSGLPLQYAFSDFGQNKSRFFLLLEIVNPKSGNTESKVSVQKIEEFYNMLTRKKVMMLYKGDLSKDIILPIVDMLHNNFSDKENLSGKEKRSMITLIETLQNISKHAKAVNGLKEGIFCMTRDLNNYVIEGGNFIIAEQHGILRDSLAAIKKMAPEQIAGLYKQRLLTPEITPEGNCGLGLLEIARHSGNNFEYDFSNTGNNELFYTLKVTI